MANGISILLIDDDARLTGPLRASFERAGYAVSVAPDGHTGLSLAMLENPQVIVLDVMMPGLDGWQVCQAIRQRSTVPIIMLTALDDRMDRIRGLELGADDYLVKPFSFQELEAHVRAMLRRVQFDTVTARPGSAGLRRSGRGPGRAYRDQGRANPWSRARRSTTCSCC